MYFLPVSIWSDKIVTNHFYPRPVLASGYCRFLHLCVCVSVCKQDCLPDNFFKVPATLLNDRHWPSRSNLTSMLPYFELIYAIFYHPFKLGSPIFAPEVQNTSFKIVIVWGWFTFKVKLNLKCQNFLFHHYRKYITTTKPTKSHENIDCFTVLTVSWSPHSARGCVDFELEWCGG